MAKMSEPYRTLEAVRQDASRHRLVRCIPDQYDQVRDWLVEAAALYADRKQYERAIHAVLEVKRLDQEMDHS